MSPRVFCSGRGRGGAGRRVDATPKHDGVVGHAVRQGEWWRGVRRGDGGRTTARAGPRLWRSGAPERGGATARMRRLGAAPDSAARRLRGPVGRMFTDAGSVLPQHEHPASRADVCRRAGRRDGEDPQASGVVQPLGDHSDAPRQRMVPVVGHTALSGDFLVCLLPHLATTCWVSRKVGASTENRLEGGDSEPETVENQPSGVRIQPFPRVLSLLGNPEHRLYGRPDLLDTYLHPPLAEGRLLLNLADGRSGIR